MRIAVIGAGVGGLAAATRLAALGHRVTVLEQAHSAGGKCGRVQLAGHSFDSGPSLFTMPWVLDELLAQTGSSLADELELIRVEPGTEYRFPDGSRVELGGDLPSTLAALERWSPGSGEDWARFLGVCAQMWRASVPFLTGPPPWPPRRPPPGVRAPDPLDLLRVRPWRTLAGLARSLCRDPRLRLVIERFATYAGADPRRAPAALAVAGYVEHAFGAWHVRGGLYAIVEALVRRFEALGGELRLNTAVRSVGVRGGRVAALETDGGSVPCEAVVSSTDALALYRDLLPSPARDRQDGPRRGAHDGPRHAARRAPRERAFAAGERSLSGFALMLGLRGRTPDLAHHTILFPSDYGAEFDDVFRHRRPVRDPTLYVSAPSASHLDEAPADGESWFVLANAPTHGNGLDWDARADAYEETVLELLARRGLEVRDRIEVRARRTPADLERETGAPGGAIYGTAPHGRIATLGRPANASGAVEGLYLAGGTVHPGGGLPLVMLSAKIAAEAIGPAR